MILSEGGARHPNRNKNRLKSETEDEVIKTGQER